jgi:hypothetical protein
MRYSFVLGVCAIYLAMIILVIEIWREVKSQIPLRVSLIGLVFVIFCVFSIRVVFRQAPVTLQSYAMKKGEYPAGTVIAGIAWDSRLTDMRVVVTDPTDDDYDNLDVEVQPDTWTYKAALLTNDSGCQLSKMPDTKAISVVLSSKGGTNKVTSVYTGGTFEGQDAVGDIFLPLVSESGYRLRCGKLPAHFSVRVVFALAVPHPGAAKTFQTLTTPPKVDKPGEYLVTEVSEFKEHLDSIFQALGPRPIPSVVQLKGHYVREMKPFKFDEHIEVVDGN